MTDEQPPQLTPEQIKDLQLDRARRYTELGGKFLKKGNPHITQAEQNLFKINAGGVVATLALMGQAMSSYPGLAGLFILPALGFTAALLAALLISYMRAQEYSDYSKQLLDFARNLPDDLSEGPKPNSTAPNSIRTLTKISGFGFCSSVIAAVLLSALYVMNALGVWSVIGGMFAQLM